MRGMYTRPLFQATALHGRRCRVTHPKRILTLLPLSSSAPQHQRLPGAEDNQPLALGADRRQHGQPATGAAGALQGEGEGCLYFSCNHC